jgi:hypothetical protein
MYEIVVFEYNSMYDSDTADSSEKALMVFVEMCRKYVSPEYVAQNEAHFDSGDMFLSYADRSGGDKPMLILLIGNITGDMTSNAEEMLKKLYVRLCEDCGTTEIPNTQTICSACANL